MGFAMLLTRKPENSKGKNEENLFIYVNFASGRIHIDGRSTEKFL